MRNPWKGRRQQRRPAKAAPQSETLPIEDHLHSGRMLAWFALQRYDETGRFLSEILADADSLHALSGQDRGLAVDVASGVVRRRRTIDTLLESQISRPRSNVEPDLWRLLQLGVFQVVFSRTPEHAAVDTTVELAKQIGCSRWCGFANGVLRNIARLIADETTNEPAVNALPIDGGTYRQLDQAVFPDPATDLQEYIGRAFSLPRSLARRWTTRLSRSDLLTTCFASLQIPETCLRINRVAASVSHVQTALQERGVEALPGHNAWSLRLAHAARITDLPGYAEGWWSVQDESAMLAAEMVDPQPCEKILDLCAAPGGKSTHLAELSRDTAEITACDVSEHRLRRIDESIGRLQFGSIETVLISRDGEDIPSGPYDAVLVDVPCSNTGVLSRRPEARWRFREDEVTELVQLQTKLLLTAMDHVRPGGRIVYSTCSIEPEETTELIANVVGLVPELTVMEERLVLPGQPAVGAFQALPLRS